MLTLFRFPLAKAELELLVVAWVVKEAILFLAVLHQPGEALERDSPLLQAKAVDQAVVGAARMVPVALVTHLSRLQLKAITAPLD